MSGIEVRHRGASLGRIKRARIISVGEVLAKDAQSVTVSGLRASSYRIDRSEDEHLSMLPTFQGKDFVKHVLLKRYQGDDPLSILDVGCGNGGFLAGMASDFPEARLVGVSASDLRGKSENTTQKEFIDKVDYRVGDMQRLKFLVEGKKFDTIISLWGLPHADDPLTVVKQIYQLLEPGGVAFLYKPFSLLSLKEADGLVEYWKEAGIEAEMHRLYPQGPGDSPYDLSFQRGEVDKLPMPFRYKISTQGRILYALKLTES